ncbi:site-specific integrase [Microvirga guangxiensis]|uniref:Site-specific recombinase XerD n=1 Tax=Microvirga guangxiensis TaxID=549386 RepID=A0A1G5G6G8_9HYPH|nr:site-specific integrase [Microvirga guangxiensis]SCY47093.1 Site-specific recombinase XerD [Microvirga guangxiensis]
MALSMSRPWKHPKTGIYWLRRGVPDDLRPIIGKREIKLSLKTKDPEKAKQEHLKALVELEEQWKNLRAGSKTLSEREAHELAQAVHDTWLTAFQDNPSQQTSWNTDIGGDLWKPLSFDLSTPLEVRLIGDPARGAHRAHEFLCREEVAALAQARGLILDEESQERLAKAIGAAIQRACLKLAQFAKGDYGKDAFIPASNTPIIVPSASARVDHKPVSFDDLVKGWSAEKRPAEKTVYEWKRVLKELKAFLKHDDAARMTAQDLVSWKNTLIAANLRPKTIRDAKLAPVRAILRWAVDNHHLKENPAERIVIDVKTKAGERKRSYQDEEAKIVLKAALTETNAVRRWVPWLCAYSGARVSEICQLRAEDIVKVERIDCMKIDPDAGSLKTLSSERIVPLHPAIIESGFLEYVRTVKSGPLFPKLSPDKFGKRGGNGTKVIGRWVRSLDLKDTRISPNHSWRHRFKTLGRRHGLAPDIVDALVGHQRRTVGDGYGEFPVEALLRELKKVPELKLDSSSD